MGQFLRMNSNGTAGPSLFSGRVGVACSRAGMNVGSVLACMEKSEASYFHYWKMEEKENNCKSHKKLLIDFSVFFSNTGQCIYKLTVGVEEHGLPTPPLQGQGSAFPKHCRPALLTNFGRMWSTFSSNEDIQHLAESIQNFTGWYPLLNKAICSIK